MYHLASIIYVLIAISYIAECREARHDGRPRVAVRCRFRALLYASVALIDLLPLVDMAAVLHGLGLLPPSTLA